METIHRNIYATLLSWLASPSRKPLILRGARQVGKSHALINFGKQNFAACHMLNFQENPELGSLFDGPLSPKSLIESIEILLDCSIDLQNNLVP